ncbi:hypothetical protein [Paraburkholderia dinghuensis]|uniref:Uncharacterized protein n=1 Tax=Paraburkholderia dinghuensis TaxID=2305225 RepID=A0A3N6MA20_9BURK|nr:hypothetical protein [Paraburkholderia dinghuensis]RQH00634.1 hypothetical protein D1Y85_24950 [Paraburkholderia dinghuensis]
MKRKTTRKASRSLLPGFARFACLPKSRYVNPKKAGDPTAHSSGVLSEIAAGSTVVSITADAVSQLAQPNVGQYACQGAVSGAGKIAGNINPAGSLIVNGATSVINNIPLATTIQNWITQKSNSLFNPSGTK